MAVLTLTDHKPLTDKANQPFGSGAAHVFIF
jgi:hypothetical protein